MNRNEEYRALLAELEQTPPELDSTVERASRRSAQRKRRRLFSLPLGSLAACFAAFVVLVNVSLPFAHACGSIPLLRELAKAVAWSPSLSAAVENEYVQPIGQTQTQNGITATVEYVIVDRKQVNLYYTLDFDPSMGELYADYDITPGQGSAGTAGSMALEPGVLTEINRDYVDVDVPEALDLTISVYREEPKSLEEPAEPMGHPLDSLFEQPVWEEPDYLAELTFHLEFDPTFTAQGETLPLHTEFTLDGQTFTLTEAEIYPTHLRLSLSADPDNTAWLEGMEMYLENEHGERFEKSINGVTAVGDPTGEGMGSFWLDSPFFSQGQHLTLHITAAQWRDKDAPRVRLDPNTGAVEHLPPVIHRLWAERRNGGIIINGVFPLRNDIMMGGFAHKVWDESGREYEIWQFGSSYGCQDPVTGEWVDSDTVFTESFPLADFQGGTVYLEPSFHRITAETAEIPIR